MEEYLRILKKIKDYGIRKPSRTGINTISLFGEKFEHDMREGFPNLTTKFVPNKIIQGETEFFIKGITDKRWLQERDIHIWDEWASPINLPEKNLSTKEFTEIVNKSYSKAKTQLENKLILNRGLEPRLEEFEKLGIKFNSDYIREINPKNENEYLAGIKLVQLTERDLGPIYGFQWRNFNGDYKSFNNFKKNGNDQLKNLVDTIKKNPFDRRMIVSVWNPNQLEIMGLPPCHYEFQVGVLDDKLNLEWSQRSVDIPIGLPFNIVSYATILHLLCKETGYYPGKLIGNLKDTHIYESQLNGVEELLLRKPKKLLFIETKNFTNIFEWNYKDTKRIDY